MWYPWCFVVKCCPQSNCFWLPQCLRAAVRPSVCIQWHRPIPKPPGESGVYVALWSHCKPEVCIQSAVWSVICTTVLLQNVDFKHPVNNASNSPSYFHPGPLLPHTEGVCPIKQQMLFSTRNTGRRSRPDAIHFCQGVTMAPGIRTQQTVPTAASISKGQKWFYCKAEAKYYAPRARTCGVHRFSLKTAWK